MRFATLLLVALLLPGCTLGQARIAAWGGVAADLISTQAAINGGYREGNGLLGDNPVLVSGLVSGAILTGAYSLEPYDPKGATWFYRFVAVVRTGMAVRNLALIHNGQGEPIDNRKKAALPLSAGVMVTW